MEMGDILGLIGIIVTAVIGPIVVSKQKSNTKKANQSADIHVSNAQVLSALVGAVESLHTKMDAIGSRSCVGATEASKTLNDMLHVLQSDIAVIKDRGSR